jgi:hypothetical protein
MKRLEVGDRLIKVDSPNVVWVVVGEAKVSTDLPPHYYLVAEDNQNRRMTISESALFDRRLYPNLSNSAMRRRLTR